MHGLSHSITFDRVLAIDLGKFNSVFCLYQRVSAEHRFGTFSMTPQTLYRHRGAGQEALGDALGDAAGRDELARSGSLLSGRHRTHNGIVFCCDGDRVNELT